MRDCPGYMPQNRHSIVLAPLKLICKIVRVIGQLRVHCVKMQKKIEALRNAIDVIYPLLPFLNYNALTMYITDET
jgi:hypothetical protein